MDQETLNSLGQSPVGQLVPIEGTDQYGREYSHFAFLPHALPSDVALSAETWTRVAAASEALGRLHQACSPLPNPALLIAPALVREAVDTSWLEGTHGAVADVLEARLSDRRPRSPEVAEIRAYERAAYQGFDLARERPIAVSWLADLQGILAAESTVPQRDPGRVRAHQVVIGPKDGTVYDSRYIPPPPDDRLHSGLQQWEEWLATDHALPPALKAAMAHYQFEALHPFGDGNGRIGRLIVILQLLRLDAISEPAITISPWLRKRRDQYQGHLLRVSKTGDWNPWVQFFCEAICEQARSQVRIVDELTIWLEQARAQVNDKHWSGTVANILTDLIEWPVITSRFIQDKYDVSAPTAKSVLDRLVDIGVLQVGQRRGATRLFEAPGVMDAVESL